jgi:hypothetical protein
MIAGKAECSVFFFCFCLVGCSTQLALSGQTREDYLKSIKAFGRYFVKPEVSEDQWRRDWVACGGMFDGGYSSDSPPGASAEMMIRASKQKRNDLAACMVAKGYEHQKGFEY